MRFVALFSALLLALSARSGIIYSPVNPVNGSIPDGSAVGWAGTATASGYLPSITAVTVNLNISGGYNGDLYAYLSYSSGNQSVLVPLLNRVGVKSGDAFGYGDTGFSIMLSSAAANDVHSYGDFTPSFNENGQLTGTWKPDGRAISPLSAPSAFDSASRVSFASYNGMNPNGTWTLFLADLSSGAQSQLVNWELGITGVPEPVNVALSVFASLFLVVTGVRSKWARNRFHQWRVAFSRWVNAV